MSFSNGDVMKAVINLEELVSRKISHIQVWGEGIVTSILNDDLKGRKHQRFVLEMALHKTLLIINNIVNKCPNHNVKYGKANVSDNI